MSESQIGGMSLMDSMQAYDIAVPNRSGEKLALSVDDEDEEPCRPPNYQDLQLGLRISSSAQNVAPDKKLRKVESDLITNMILKPMVRHTKDRSRDTGSDPHTGKGASGPEIGDHELKGNKLKDSEGAALENTKKKESISNATSEVTHSSQTEKHHSSVLNHQGSSGSRATNFLDSKSTVWPAKAEVQKFEVLKGSPSSIQASSGWEQSSPGLKHLSGGVAAHPSAGLVHDRLLNKHLTSTTENIQQKGIKNSKESMATSIATQERISGSRSQASDHRGYNVVPASLRDSRERDPSLGSDSASLASSVQKNLGNAAILKKVSSNLNRMSKKSSDFPKESSGRASPSIEARTHLFPAPKGVSSLQREPLSQNSQNYSMNSGASNPASRSKSRDRGTEVIKPSISTTVVPNPAFSHASSSFGLSASKSNNGKLKKPNTAEPENLKVPTAGEGFKKKSYYNILKTSCKEHAERLFQDKQDHIKKKEPPRVNSRVLAMIKNISAAPGLTSLMANGIGTRSAKNPSSRDSSNSAKRSTHSGHAKSTKSKTSSTGSNFDPHDLKRGLKFRPEVPDRMKSASKKARNTIDLTGSKTGVLSSHPGKGLLSLAASSSGSTGFQDKFATHTLGGVLRKNAKNRNLTSESDQEDDSSLEEHLKLHRLDCLKGPEVLDIQQSRKLNEILKKMHIPEHEENALHAPQKLGLKPPETIKREIQATNKFNLPPTGDRPPSSAQKQLLSIPAISSQFGEMPKGMIKSSSSGKRDDQRPLSSSGVAKSSAYVSGSSHLKTPKDPRSGLQAGNVDKPNSNSQVSGLLLNSQIEISGHPKAKTPHRVEGPRLGQQIPHSFVNHSTSLKDSTPLFQQETKKKKPVTNIAEGTSTTTNAKNLLLNAQLSTPAAVAEVRGGVGSVSTKQGEPRPRSSSSKGRKQYQPTALSSIKNSLGVSGHSAAGLNIFSPNSYLITHVHQVNNFINK